jgi:hypothetical protein
MTKQIIQHFWVLSTEFPIPNRWRNGIDFSRESWCSKNLGWRVSNAIMAAGGWLIDSQSVGDGTSVVWSWATNDELLGVGSMYRRGEVEVELDSLMMSRLKPSLTLDLCLVLSSEDHKVIWQRTLPIILFCWETASHCWRKCDGATIDHLWQFPDFLTLLLNNLAAFHNS